MLTINVVTLFPEVFTAALAASIPGRAAAAGLVRYRVVQLRDYTHDRHHTVDDAPYGGSQGMVMKCEPIFEAVEALRPLVPPGANLAQLALRWILMFPAVTCAIPGAKRVAQVEENVAANDLPPLPEETMSKISDIYEQQVRGHVHHYW